MGYFGSVSIFRFCKQQADYAVLTLLLRQIFENLIALFLGLRLSELASEQCKFFTVGEQAHLSFPRLLNSQRRLLPGSVSVELKVWDIAARSPRATFVSPQQLELT